MSEHKKSKQSDATAEKAGGKDAVPKKKDKKRKRRDEEAGNGPLSLLADESVINPVLSSLFAPKPMPLKPTTKILARKSHKDAVSNDVSNTSEPQAEINGNRRVLEQPMNGDSSVSSASSPEPDARSTRKRKRKEREGNIEDAYMHRLAQEEAKDAESLAKASASKRQKTTEGNAGSDQVDDDDYVAVAVEDEDGAQISAPLEDERDAASSPPPRHETQQAADDEILKANRTVFLGNVSTTAVSSKAARKALVTHLKSFFETVPEPKDGEPKHAIESIRFRSTPFANSIPKKAAFATKQLMDATTKSTNAYAVYSSPSLARLAAKHLNATVVLGRHLRVDSVAHPSPVDNKRCVFVGNLGFVDDETNIQAANEEEGKEKRKPGKHPADVEEGLWRTFGKCGAVESVRVIRDSTTRVGKGIAYVQFEDANAVEAALLYEGKKFPPMLPRKLRVSRAKAQKRNAKIGSNIPSSRPKTNGYQRKVTGEEASKMGRANKLFGRAGAAHLKNEFRRGQPPTQDNGIKPVESFVFEGHRASSKSGKSGLKLGGRGKKKPGKPTSRSAKRGAAFKAKKPKA